MIDFSSRDISLIMESYKKITTVKDVTTEEPKKVVKKADIAEPVKKAVPANVCKEAPKTLVKEQNIFEAENVEEKSEEVKADDVKVEAPKADVKEETDVAEGDEGSADDEGAADADGEGDEGDDGEEVSAERVQNSFDTMTPEELRAYFKKLAMDAQKKYRSDIDDGIRAKLGDDEFAKYLERTAADREAADKAAEEQIDAELAKLDADTAKWMKDNGYPEKDGDDASDAKADDKADDKASDAEKSDKEVVKADDTEEFWSQKIKFNGREITRKDAKNKCMSKIAQIDSMEGDDEANEEKVAVIQNIIREIRRGADEISVNLNECVCESTTKRCFCGKGKKRLFGTKKCCCKK